MPPHLFSFWCVLKSCENGKEELFPMNNLISRFRANIITNGTRAFEEEKWDEISIGSLRFQVSSQKSYYLSLRVVSGDWPQPLAGIVADRRESHPWGWLLPTKPQQEGMWHLHPGSPFGMIHPSFLQGGWPFHMKKRECTGDGGTDLVAISRLAISWNVCVCENFLLLKLAVWSSRRTSRCFMVLRHLGRLYFSRSSFWPHWKLGRSLQSKD